MRIRAGGGIIALLSLLAACSSSRGKCSPGAAGSCALEGDASAGATGKAGVRGDGSAGVTGAAGATETTGDGGADATGTAGNGSAGAAGDASGGSGGMSGAGGTGGTGGMPGLTDAGTDTPTDGPVAVCGNGIVESNEDCEYPSGPLCIDCHYTVCGSCLAGQGATEKVCQTLTGADRLACVALWTCLSIGGFSCAIAPGGLCAHDCYGAGVCVNEFQTLAHSTDKAEVERQMSADTPLGALWGEAAKAACTTFAYQFCGHPPSPSYAPACGFDPGPVMNEVDYQQPGGDDREFVEIYNTAWTPIDFTGVKLFFFDSDGQRLNGTPYLSVALSGTLPVGGYLVVGSSNVAVPAGVQKIDLPAASNNIHNGPGAVCLPNHKSMLVWGLPVGFKYELTPDVFGCSLGGAGEPAGLTGDDGLAPRSLCRLPNGANNDRNPNYETNTLEDWTKPCAMPTPGAANVQ